MLKSDFNGDLTYQELELQNANMYLRAKVRDLTLFLYAPPPKKKKTKERLNIWCRYLRLREHNSNWTWCQHLNTGLWLHNLMMFRISSLLTSWILIRNTLVRIVLTAPLTKVLYYDTNASFNKHLASLAYYEKVHEIHWSQFIKDNPYFNNNIYKDNVTWYLRFFHLIGV